MDVGYGKYIKYKIIRNSVFSFLKKGKKSKAKISASIEVEKL